MGADSHLVVVVVATVVGVAVGGFLLGGLSPAAWIARALGHDLHRSGSGNPGATNAGRVLGVRWGVIVALLDVLKGWLPTYLVLRTMGPALAGIAGVTLVLGHVFSPFLRGRGGKGVATTLGVLLALTPWIALVGVVAFAGWMALRRQVGEGSVAASLAIAISGLLAALGVLPLASPRSLGLVVLGLAVLVIARHRRNIGLALERARRRAQA